MPKVASKDDPKGVEASAIDLWTPEDFGRAAEASHKVEALLLEQELLEARATQVDATVTLDPLNVPETLKSSYLVNFVDFLYDYRMFLPEGSDDRQIEIAELLVENGFQQDKALDLAAKITARFQTASSVPVEHNESEAAEEFRQASQTPEQSPASDRTVAGAPFSEFKAYADQHQWKTRRERGYSWNADVLDYVRNVYGSWIERGKASGQRLTQAHIKSVDGHLWARLQKETLPVSFDLPTEREAGLIGLNDSDREKVELAREASRTAKSLRRKAGLS